MVCNTGHRGKMIERIEAESETSEVMEMKKSMR